MEVSLWGRQQKTIAGQVQKTRSISEYVPAVSKGQSCSGEVKAGAVPHILSASSSDKLPGEQSHLLLWKPESEAPLRRRLQEPQPVPGLSSLCPSSGGSSSAEWDVPVLVFLYLLCHPAPASVFDG